MAQNAPPEELSLYKPLPPNSTRLLQITYRGEDQPHLKLVTCTFDVSADDGSLVSSKPYRAVSYTWGGPSRLFSISILDEKDEAHTLKVTETLLRCLENWCALARKQREAIFIWVDQVTINQADFEEKAAQVRQMRRIYQAAEWVVVWFGDPPDALQSTVKRLEGIYSIISGRQGEVLPFELSEATQKGYDWLMHVVDGLLSEPLSPDDAVVRDCLLQILDSPWFSRAWILQEAAAAPVSKIVFHWDGFMTPFGPIYVFIVTIRELKSNFWDRIADESPVWRFAATEGSNTIARIDALRGILDGTSRKLALWDLLELLRHSQATDPRDKIYPMLEQAFDLHSGDPILFIDYRIPMDLLSARLIRWHLLTYQNLDFLGYCGYDSVTSEGWYCKQSWMPDFVRHRSIAKMHTLITQPDRQPLYRASGTPPVALLVNEQAMAERQLHFLRLSGGFLMKAKDIVFPDNPNPYLPYAEDWAATTEEYHGGPAWHFGTHREFWSSVLCDLRNKQERLRPSGTDVNTFYEYALAADQVELDDGEGQCQFRFRRSQIVNGRAPPVTAPLQPAVNKSHIMNRVRFHETGRTSLFTCGPPGSSGSLWVGSCPAGRVRPDDEIWMLRGSSVLQVLRRLRRPLFTGFCLDLADGRHGVMRIKPLVPVYGFVAQCYVHGLMDGELLEMMDKNSSREPIEGMDQELRNIILV